jgi:hypothetical protein
LFPFSYHSYQFRGAEQRAGHQFIETLTISQKNSLRLLLAKDAAADLHYLLGVQKAVTRAVTEAEHKLALAKSGRTAELF